MKQVFFFLVIFAVLASFALAQPCEENERRPCGFSDKGECRYGTQICTFGQWSLCLGSKAPIEEICGNDKDDDCDGTVDEECECSKGEKRQCGRTDEGICEYGKEFCVNGTWSGQCLNQTKPKTTEICSNRLDDDCDGRVDEGCEQLNKTQQPTTTCFNKVKDGNETGIDCGGPCKSCASCTDGILNQGEKNIKLDLGGSNISDCGGPHCPPCPNCYDGAQNQGEQGIDCGGPCKKCTSKDDEDLDKDGLSHRMELQKGTDPNKADTDGDGLNDQVDKLPLCPNTYCDDGYGENENTCPQDCVPESSFSFGLIIAILFLLLLCVGGYFYYQFKKGTKKIEKTMQQPGKKLVFDPYKYRTGAAPREKTRKSSTEKQLEKSLKKAEKFFK